MPTSQTPPYGISSPPLPPVFGAPVLPQPLTDEAILHSERLLQLTQPEAGSLKERGQDPHLRQRQQLAAAVQTALLDGVAHPRRRGAIAFSNAVGLLSQLEALGGSQSFEDALLDLRLQVLVLLARVRRFHQENSP